MDWRALQDVVTVAETGSLSAAARCLKVSQPTVGRRIGLLEQKLGAVLFTRTAQGLLLTELGESIIENAKRMQEEALAIERLATGANQQLQGTVRLSLIEDLGIFWLPKKLAEFQTEFPQLSVEVNIDNKNVNLLRREADVAVRLARPEQPDLICRKVGHFNMGLYASREYLAKHGTPKRLSDLKNHYHVGFDADMGYSSQRNILESLFTAENIRHRSNSHLEMIEATRSGIGCGMLSCLIADSHEELQRLYPGKIYHEQDIWLVTHSEIHKNARIRVIFDFLTKALEGDADRFAG
ncbi:MAG: LysR family transcriptional regulator [Arenicellales bacterium]